MPSENEERTMRFTLMCQYLRNVAYDAVDAKTIGIAALYVDLIGSYNNPEKYQRDLLDYAKEYITRNLPPKMSFSELIDNVHEYANNYQDNVVFAQMLMTEHRLENKYQADPYTPNQIINLVCKILNVKSYDIVFDLGSGLGNFLAAVANYSGKNESKCMVVGEEINKVYAKISEMYLDLNNIDHFKIENIDAITSLKTVSFSKGYVFPPVGLQYGADYFARMNNNYGDLFNSKTNSEWMFVIKAMEGMAEDGRLVALIPDGALFRSPSRAVRKYMVENNYLEGIIALPSGVFPYSGIMTDILVIGKNNNNAIKVIDASEYVNKEAKRMAEVSIPVDEIYNLYNSDDVITFSKETAAAHDYNLTVHNYLKATNIYEKVIKPAPINNVANIIVGSQYTLAHFKGVISPKATEYQLLTSGNIDNGLIDYNSMEFIENDEKLLKFELQENDLVVTTKSTKVKTAVAQGLPNRHIIVTGGMIIVRPDIKKMNPTYLKMFLDSEIGQTILRTVQKGTVITTISINEFKNIKVACPSIKEQDKLAKKYNQLLYMYEGIKAEMKNTELELAELYVSSLKDGE